MCIHARSVRVPVVVGSFRMRVPCSMLLLLATGVLACAEDAFSCVLLDVMPKVADALGAAVFPYMLQVQTRRE